MKKKFNAHIYLERKIGLRDMLSSQAENDGYLFAQGRYRTKIKAADLPGWFVYGYIYKIYGYISAKGVKHMVYNPNYVFNHLFKDDFLYIAYDKKITAPVSGDAFVKYEGYDELI